MTASFQTTTLIYDATVWFCEKFLDSRSRTIDQMVQAARSGRQNIAEGSRAAATSSQTELRLVNVARASLEELLLDYEDFLRHRRLLQWAPDSREAMEVRDVPKAFRNARKELANFSELDDAQRWALYSRWLDAPDAICLIHQANFLLDRQIAALEAEFVEGGGYSEQLAQARLAERRRKDRTAPAGSSNHSLKCPECGGIMALRTAKAGKTPGSQFWGCTNYPECKGTSPV